MATQWTERDGPFLAHFIIDNGVVFKKLINANGNAIKQKNQVDQRRPQRKMDWGQHVADIPETDIPILRQHFGPEFLNPHADKESRKRAMTRFMCSPISDEYRKQERRRYGL